MSRYARFAFALSLVFLVAGCGSSGHVVVTGELRNKGEVYKPAAGEQVMVTFGLEANGVVSGKTFPTRLNADGTFKLTGPDDRGIPVGKYRVSVTCMPEVPVPGKPPIVKFPTVFDIQKSPLAVEVSPSQSIAKLEIP